MKMTPARRKWLERLEVEPFARPRTKSECEAEMRCWLWDWTETMGDRRQIVTPAGRAALAKERERERRE